MIKRVLTALCCSAALAAPADALADTTIAADPAAKQVTALNGTVVWVSGEFGNQKLMQRTSAGTARVEGAPVAKAYRSVDLGLDRSGRLTLTYLRCTSASSCVALRDDLAGKRATLKPRAVTRCSPTTAPALWRDRMAFGLACRTASGRADDARSGLYVQRGTSAPKRLPLPADAKKYGADEIRSVDLRGTRAAAVTADIYEYAFAVDVTGARRVAFLAAASEGESDAHANGLALGSGGTLWALTTAEHAGDPKESIVFRHGGALERERIANATAAEPEFPAVDLAVDGATVYLAVPGTGIVRHAFAPTA